MLKKLLLPAVALCMIAGSAMAQGDSCNVTIIVNTAWAKNHFVSFTNQPTHINPHESSALALVRPGVQIVSFERHCQSGTELIQASPVKAIQAKNIENTFMSKAIYPMDKNIQVVFPNDFEGAPDKPNS